MSTPITCELNNGLVYSGNYGDMKVKGHLDVVWNHRTGEPTEVVGFELLMYSGNDIMSFSTGLNSPGINAVWKAVEYLLGDKLINIAKDHCDHEPPTDGDLEDEIDYQENLDDFYPSRPRG